MKTGIKAALGLLLLGAGGAGGLLYWRKVQFDHEWHRLHDPIAMPEDIARVPARWNAAELAAHLQESGKVRSAAVFLEESAAVGLQAAEPGGYILPHRASPHDLALLFKAPPALLKVTFPEGYTVGQMATRLQQTGFRDAANLRRLAYPTATAPSPWEGKMFPDTYMLPRNADAKHLAGRLFDRWNQIARALPHPFPQVNGKRLTLSEVTVLASLVEREAASDAERPIIAGVLVNRLRQKMRLQCDAGVLYGMRRAALAAGRPLPPIVTRDDYRVPSPFNTYLIDGLPKGAICNPGAASLRAAAHPATTPYLFYVLSPTSHRHRFATTFAGHQYNIRLAHLERAAQPPATH